MNITEKQARSVAYAALGAALCATLNAASGDAAIWDLMALAGAWVAALVALATRRRLDERARRLTDAVVAAAALLNGLGASLDYATGKHRLVDKVLVIATLVLVAAEGISIVRAHRSATRSRSTTPPSPPA